MCSYCVRMSPTSGCWWTRSIASSPILTTRCCRCLPSVERAGLFAGCISGRDTGIDDLIMVNAPALLAEPSMAELTTGHRDLYLVADDAQRSAETRRRPGRETWVTFQLDRLMGLRIEQLCEVIDYNRALIRPPGAPAHVRGVLNLRQALITVVDLRTLYHMAEAEDLAASKILIVEHGGHKYGLVVDAVENIISIDRADKLHIPAMVKQQLNPDLRHDLREVVYLPDKTTVMLMDSLPLMQRLTGIEIPQGEPIGLLDTAT